MSQQSKTERRKEQNRKAQASHRKRKQERLQYLEQKLTQLADSRSSNSSTDSPTDFEANNQLRNRSFALGLQQSITNDLPGISTGDDALFLTLANTQICHNVSAFIDTGDNSSRLLPREGSELQAPIERGGALSPLAVNSSSGHLAQPGCRDAAEQTRPQLRKPLCIFDALAFNARRLQYSNESLVGSHGVSTFFSPLCQIDSSQFPADLQPAWSQMTYQHHPYIDCIPWPDFRSRIILAQAHTPPLIDCFAVWHDILLGGITCGPDPSNVSQWKLDVNFEKKYEALLSYDLPTLQARTLATNPPLRLVIPTP